MGKIRTRDEIVAERRRLRRKYGTLYDGVTQILFKHDPIHIGYTPDEYELETERILPRIAGCASKRELTDLVHDVFREMFSPEIAGARARYEGISRDIWRLATEKGRAQVPA